MTTPISPIKLYSIADSRSIRIAWLLEELGVPYEVVTGTRLSNFDSDPSFRKEVGGLGKAPTILDGDLRVQESGAITE